MGANVRGRTSFIDMYPRPSRRTTFSIYYSIRGTVNTQVLEPDHPIHWYNGALASYFLEDYEEALQATTRALELLPHNKQIRALHLEVDRIFNGSEDPNEQQESEASAPAEQEEQGLDATEEKVPEKQERPESPAKKKPEKKKDK